MASENTESNNVILEETEEQDVPQVDTTVSAVPAVPEESETENASNTGNAGEHAQQTLVPGSTSNLHSVHASATSINEQKAGSRRQSQEQVRTSQLKLNGGPSNVSLSGLPSNAELGNTSSAAMASQDMETVNSVASTGKLKSGLSTTTTNVNEDGHVVEGIDEEDENEAGSSDGQDALTEPHPDVMQESNMSTTEIGEANQPIEITRSTDLFGNLEADQNAVEELVELHNAEMNEEVVENTTARLIMSPEPVSNDDDTMVDNLDGVGDDDKDLLQFGTKLSRDNSVNGLNQQGEDVVADITKELRPTTPADILNESRRSQNGVNDSLTDSTKETETPQEEVVQIDREELIASIKALLDKKDKLKMRNIGLQSKLSEYFRKKKQTDDNRDSEKSVADHESRYVSCLASLAELRGDYQKLHENHQRTIEEYQQKLFERQKEAGRKSAEFTKYRRTIALSAENTRTGKPIPPKVIEQLETLDAKREAEVSAVRLENIRLRNRLRRNEQMLREKEELADGLHLIDFEQLKIENQTYNEKIEERNEELLKLRKKITNVVQVLTHVKEKLQFVQAENIDLKQELVMLDAEVGKKRDTLPAAKQKRDKLRNHTIELRQKNGLVGNVPLLRDYENKVDECAILQERIDQLRSYHADVSAEILAYKRQIKKSQLNLDLGFV